MAKQAWSGLICRVAASSNNTLNRSNPTIFCVLGMLTVAGGILLMLSGTAFAKSVNLDAAWGMNNYYDSENSENDSHSYRQRYFLNWYPAISSRVNLNTTMNYARNWQSKTGYNEFASPAVTLDVRNDLFNADLRASMNYNNRENTFNNRSRNWEGSIRNGALYELMPILTLRYGETYEDDGADYLITDNESRWWEAALEWNYRQLRTYYSYYLRTFDDFVEQYTNDNIRHFGRVDYTDSLLNNRVRYGISQTVNLNTNEFEFRGDRAEISVPVSQGLAGGDATPQFGTLPDNAKLIDGNLDNLAFTIRINEPANIGVRTDFQRVDALYVSIQEPPGVVADHLLAIRWDIYSSEDGSDWVREIANAPTQYNIIEHRYEVQTGGLQAIHLKLVVTDWPVLTGDVNITEMEAYQTVVGEGASGERRNDSYTTNFNFQADPTDNTVFSYFLGWNTSDNNFGNDSERISNNASLQWNVNRYFLPTVSVSDLQNKNSDVEDTETRNYSLSVQSHPLDTYDTSIGLSRFETYVESEKRRTGHNLSWLNSAILYPRLTTQLDFILGTSTDELRDTDSTNASVYWRLTSHVRDNLSVDFISEYRKNSTEAVFVEDIESDGGSSSLDINWRVSDLLSIRGSGVLGYGDSADDYDSVFISPTVILMRTAKSLVQSAYMFNANRNDTIHTFNLNWSWNLSEYFSFNAIGNYLILEDTNIWYINCYLTSRF
ncbi:MAG TPA: hypothetical protein ENN06_02490 [Desulfobacteraceae bacterium]|nr:hypothetical protein [Desulfobacteraceae bacterium]